MSRLRKGTAAIAIAIAGLSGGAVSAASWHTFFSPADGTVPSAWAAGSAVSAISGFQMSVCSQGTWSRTFGVQNGGYFIHNHVLSGVGYCATASISHDHPGSYVVCYQASSNPGNNYAYCKAKY
jgi:hypothetical protein